MSTHYYYLAASLSTLTPDCRPPLSNEEFLILCHQHVSSRDLKHLIDARIDDFVNQPTNAVTITWKVFDSNLREQLLNLRAPSLGRKISDFSRSEWDQTIFTTEAVRAVFELSDPLEAELALFDLRWRYLSEIDQLHFMCLENLIIYTLQLQLIESRHAMNQEYGISTLNAIRHDFSNQLPVWNQS